MIDFQTIKYTFEKNFMFFTVIYLLASGHFASSLRKKEKNTFFTNLLLRQEHCHNLRIQGNFLKIVFDNPGNVCCFYFAFFTLRRISLES